MGNPIRPELARATRQDGIKHFQLENDLPTVLVTGGSQGAAQINNLVLTALPQLLEICQIIHLTGEGEYERVKFELRRGKKMAQAKRYHPQAFLMGEMGAALAAADIVVSRAGVNAITDAAALGKPSVLIPNYKMAGHQVENARVLSRLGAAAVLDGRTLTADRLVGEIKRLLGDETERERLGKALKDFARPEAAVDLAKLIIQTGRGVSRA